MISVELPPLTRLRQRFSDTRITDLEGEVRRQLDGCGVRVRPGQRIALAVGSRGIANLPRFVAEIVRWVRAQGAAPFLIPAMGSHGGATAAGQRQVLEDYGVTEAAMGAPIHSSMETVQLPPDGLPLQVHWDRHAHEADGVIILNRIKPHTCFHATYESGLMKMLVIGLGKHQGALALHRLGVPGLREVLPQVARHLLAHEKVLLGLAIVENAYDQTCLLKALPAARIPAEEPALLDEARRQMPSLPLRDIDILIVDRLGKDLSGTGLDPNIIGRMRVPGMPEPDYPRVRMLVVLDITPASHGNALGIGLADVTTQRLRDQINFPAMYENLYTSSFLERGKVPIVAATDREALAFAFRGCTPLEPAGARIIRIPNTLHLDELHVSPVVLNELAGCSRIQVQGPVGAPFDGTGNLRPF